MGYTILRGGRVLDEAASKFRVASSAPCRRAFRSAERRGSAWSAAGSYDLEGVGEVDYLAGRGGVWVRQCSRDGLGRDDVAAAGLPAAVDLKLVPVVTAEIRGAMEGGEVPEEVVGGEVGLEGGART